MANREEVENAPEDTFIPSSPRELLDVFQGPGTPKSPL
jgi:hypothetical protein